MQTIVLQKYGEDAALVRLKEDGTPLPCEPFVYAYGYKEEFKSWRSGEYFQTLESLGCFLKNRELSDNASHIFKTAVSADEKIIGYKIWTTEDVLNEAEEMQREGRIPQDYDLSKLENIPDIKALSDCTDSDWEILRYKISEFIEKGGVTMDDYIVVYIPAKDETLLAYYGSGENLDQEDIEAGFDSYLNYYSYKGNVPTSL